MGEMVIKLQMVDALGVTKKRSAPTQGFKGILGSIKELKSTLAILGIFTGLLASSKSLIKAVSGIGKVLMLFLKPIGDLIAMLLKPIYMFFKPIAKAFNAFFKVYQVEANKAIKAGLIFAKAGMPEKATDSFLTGFTILFKPFFDLILLAGAEAVKLMVDVIFFPFQTFLEGMAIAMDAIGFESAAQAFRDLLLGLDVAKEGIKTQIDDLAKKAIDSTNAVLFGHADALYATALNIKEVMTNSASLTLEEKTALEPIFAEIDKMPIKAALESSTQLSKMSTAWTDAATHTRGIMDQIEAYRDSLMETDELPRTEITANKSNLEKANEWGDKVFNNVIGLFTSGALQINR